jgi:hypothetical protein
MLLRGFTIMEGRLLSKVIAMCGLICDDCIAFIATQKDDDELRRKVVEAWSTEDEKLKLEDIDCDGCIVGKRLHSFCAICDVRLCGLQRNVENCAHCNEFPCERLEKQWVALSTVSGEKAKANLLEIRKSRV